MGYNTNYEGELRFNKELSIQELNKLKTFLNEDCRDHPEWNREDLTHIDLEFLDDFSGLRYNGAEKSYQMTEKINLIINEMKKEFPDFELSGGFSAHDDYGEKWIIEIENNVAIEKEYKSITKILIDKLRGGN